MNASDESQQENNIDPHLTQDEFASGDPNKVRLLALRLTHRLFNPPHFPSELIWFLMAIIAGNIALELLSQPDEYWLDPGKSTSHTFLLLPSSLGSLTVGIQLGYMLLIGLVLSLVNTWAAFVIWLGLSLYHLVAITDLFRCGAVNYFFFAGPGNCSDWHTAVIALAGVAWGIGLMAAARRGLVSWAASRRGSFVCCHVLGESARDLFHCIDSGHGSRRDNGSHLCSQTVLAAGDKWERACSTHGSSPRVRYKKICCGAVWGHRRLGAEHRLEHHQRNLGMEWKRMESITSGEQPITAPGSRNGVR
jgi:hypothetical protein